MSRVPWLKLQGVANVQAISAAGYRELTETRGRFETVVVAKIKDALRWAFNL
jgi:mRNA-degrading endonuclease toxin of MazEF toxin-antitoxin module